MNADTTYKARFSSEFLFFSMADQSSADQVVYPKLNGKKPLLYRKNSINLGEGDKGEAPNMFYPQPPSVISNLNPLFLLTSTLRATTSSPFTSKGKR